MKIEGTFTSFDFSNVWQIDPALNDGYPFLRATAVFAAPTVVLSAVSASSTTRNIQFRLTATSGQVDCGTLSTVDGVDFNLTNIASITVVQTSSTVCTISAVSTISADGASGSSSLAEASTFAVSYTGSAVQANISSGSPASVAIAIPAATTTTTTTIAPATTAPAATTTTVTSPVSPVTTAPAVGGSPTTVAPASPSATVAPGAPSGTAAPSGGSTPATTRTSGDSTDAPTQIASATTTTTTTTPAASTTTLPPLDVPSVSTGGGALTIGGQRVEATITRENNQLILEAGPIVARISAIKREGGRAPLDADGRIRMMTGDSVEVEVSGFGPSTEVEVRLYSEPTLLGRTGVSADGTLLASYEIPDGVSDGDHTVVLAGESADAEELVFALSVAIGEPGDGAPWFTIFVLVPLGLAAVGALVIPAVLRRRREEQPA